VQAAKDVVNGTWKSSTRWLGFNGDVVRMSPFNDSLSADVIAAAEKAMSEIKSGDLHPYAGELKAQDGQVRVQAGSVLPDQEIRGFNWFVEGMIGNLG